MYTRYQKQAVLLAGLMVWEGKLTLDDIKFFLQCQEMFAKKQVLTSKEVWEHMVTIKYPLVLRHIQCLVENGYFARTHRGIKLNIKKLEELNNLF